MSEAKLVAKIMAQLDSSNLMKEMQAMRSAIEKGAQGIDNALGMAKARGIKSFADLIKSAENFAVTLRSLASQKDPFKNMFSSINQVNIEIQNTIGHLKELSQLKVSLNIGKPGGGSLGAESISSQSTGTAKTKDQGSRDIRSFPAALNAIRSEIYKGNITNYSQAEVELRKLVADLPNFKEKAVRKALNQIRTTLPEDYTQTSNQANRRSNVLGLKSDLGAKIEAENITKYEDFIKARDKLIASGKYILPGEGKMTEPVNKFLNQLANKYRLEGAPEKVTPFESSAEAQAVRTYIQNRIKEWVPKGGYANIKGLLSEFTGPSGRSKMSPSVLLSQLKGAGLDLSSISDLPEFSAIQDKASLKRLIANIASKQAPLANKLRSNLKGMQNYDKYLQDYQNYLDKLEDRQARAYANSKQGIDARILGGGAKSYEELRRYAKIKTPDADMAGFQKEVTSKLQGFGYSAEQVKNLSKELTNLHLKTNGMTQSSGFLAKAWEQQTQALGRLFRYYTSFFILSGIQTDLVNAASAAIKFKDSMLEVKKFLPEGSPLGALQASVIPMANEYAVSMDTVLGSYAEFAKQGKAANEIVDLTRSALLGVNVASADYATVVTYLTTATNVWGYSTKETVGLIDKLAYVQAKSSAESTHLIASMQRTASMAKQFGLSLDEVLGYTAAVSEKTMLPGEVIGTSMKTIIERSQRLKTLQELSKMQPFQNIQFINPFTGDMMKANDVLGLVAKSWKTLTDEQQKSVGELLAGGRQVNTFIALMENYDRALNLTKESMTSWGYATKANETEMEKFSKSWAKFRGMMIEQFGAGMFAPIIAGTQSVINWLNKGADASYGLGIAFGALVVSIVGGAGVALAFNKIMLGLQAYQTAAAAATIGTNALTAALTALGLSTPAGWIGLITAGVTAATAIYLGWSSATSKQTEEQNALNKSLTETANKIEGIIKSIPKAGMQSAIQQSVDVVKNMSEKDINAYIKAGGRLATTPQGERYIPLTGKTEATFTEIKKGTSALAPDQQKAANIFYESFNRQFLDLIGGISEDNLSNFFEEVSKIRDVNFENDINLQLNYIKSQQGSISLSPEIIRIYAKWEAVGQDISKLTLQEQIAMFNERQKEMESLDKNDLLYKTGISSGTAKSFISPAYFQNIGEKVTSEMLKQLPDSFVKYLSSMEGWLNFAKKETPTKAQNQYDQQAEINKQQENLYKQIRSNILDDTKRQMSGTARPAYRGELDVANVRNAMKQMEEEQAKYNNLLREAAELKKQVAINPADAEAGKKLSELTDSQSGAIERQKNILDLTTQAFKEFQSSQILASDSTTVLEKLVASLTIKIGDMTSIVNQMSNSLSSSFDMIRSSVSNLIDYVQNLINKLLSIPSSISVAINIATNMMGNAMGGAFKAVGDILSPLLGAGKSAGAALLNSGQARAIIGEMDKIINDPEFKKASEAKKAGKSTTTQDVVIQRGQEKLDSYKNTVDELGKKELINNDLVAKAWDKKTEAMRMSQKEAGAGAAKRESEDKAHQAALEKIHQMEQQISVQKKVQSFWENQLTDTVKRRWEREIRDLKSKSATYAEMSKMAGLKPEEARQYERQARETANEAKLMEDKRGEIERQYQMEMAQKRFNRALEETNKLFEYQQQIKSLDFEMGYTTEAEQQRFQMMQQEEKVQFAINQYNEIYANERNRILESIRAEQEGQGAITAEVEARIQTQLEEQMILSETVQRAKERVVEEQRATVMLEKRLRNEIFARAKQSVSEIQSTLAGAISSMFDNSAAEEKLKRIKEIMDEIAKLQQDSEFAGYNVAGAEATGSIDSINQAREKWYEVNQQMVEARKKLDEVGESTNKWKETLKSIGDTVLKKISERFAEMIMDKSGLGDMLMKMFVGIDGIGRGGTTKASQGATALATILPSQLGGPILSKAMSATLGGAGLSPTMTGPTSIVVNQSGGSGGGLDLSSLLGGKMSGGAGSTAMVRNAYTGRMEAASAAKTKTFGPINYLTAAMLGYGIGSSTNNRAVGVLGGAAAGFLTAGPVGAIIGGIASLFGKKRGDDTPPPVAPAREFYALAKNTESLDANTRALNKISEGTFNAPSAFEFNKLQAEANAPRQTFNLTVNVSGSMNRAMATEVGNTILQTVSQGMSQSAPRTATVSTANWG